MALLHQTLETFLNELASKSPTPGGGSVAALIGAMAAGLVTMVCDLTIGKKQYAAFEPQALDLRARAETLRARLQELAQADIDAFNRVLAAYKLPRATEVDIAIRKSEIQNQLRLATEVLLDTAQAASEVLPLCTPLARDGNRTAVGDVGAAVALVRATIEAALVNVESNLGALEDLGYVRQVRTRTLELRGGLDDAVGAAYAQIQERMQ